MLYTLRPWGREKRPAPINEQWGSRQVNEVTGRIFSEKTYCLREATNIYMHTRRLSMTSWTGYRGSNAYCSCFRQQMGGKSLRGEAKRRKVFTSSSLQRVVSLQSIAASLLPSLPTQGCGFHTATTAACSGPQSILPVRPALLQTGLNRCTAVRETEKKKTQHQRKDITEHSKSFKRMKLHVHATLTNCSVIAAFY